MRTWWLLLGLVVAAWGCVSSSSVQCGDITCPENTECRALTAPDEQICATKTQIEQCMGKVEGDTCDAGWCHDGVCLPITCGNNRVDRSEVCDDGNTVTGDGTCSGDCASDEKCGNGVVDPLKLGMMGDKEPNEQCDDANFVSGDGCSSTCLREELRWQQLDPNPPSALYGVAMAYDAARQRVVLFGGRSIIGGKDVQFDGTYEWNGFGWNHVPTGDAPSARLAAGMYYDPVRHRTVLFGGMVGDNNDDALRDMWEWDGRDWTYVLPPSVVPPRRSRFGLAYDGKRKVAVLFGGFDSNGPRSDTWEFDGTTWKENTSATHPPAQYEAVFVYDPKRGVIVMAGGAASPSETWEYDGTWRKITSAPPPGDLQRSAAAYVPALGKVVAHGGFNTQTSAWSLQTYSYDGTQWRNLNALNFTGAREEAAMVADPVLGNVVLFGGLVDGVTPNNDTWLYDTSSNTWVLSRSQSVPPALQFATAAYDPTTGTAWVFGGKDNTNTPRADIWSYDGSIWRTFTGSGPPASYLAGSAYDTEHHKFVLYNGQGASTNETWLFDGLSWTKPTTTLDPGMRTGEAMTYDIKRKRVVLQGGAGTGGMTETWEWNGSAWASMSPSPNPGERLGAGSTYDLTTRSVVVTSGETPTGPVADLWSYDGAWTNTTPLAPFEARGLQTLTSIGARASIMMFAGAAAGGGVFGDLWEYRHSTWTRLNAGNHPPARTGQIAFPTRRGDGLVLFGGSPSAESPINAFNDVWRLLSTSATPVETCTDAKVDSDGDGLAGCEDPDCWATCTPLCPPGTTCDPADPKCGDATCNTALETCRSCPGDCGACTAVCGDAYCDPGETAAACPGDCP